jgi:ABC-type dipeptide/oligopeptide/nickel transport system permease subunit
MPDLTHGSTLNFWAFGTRLCDGIEASKRLASWVALILFIGLTLRGAFEIMASSGIWQIDLSNTLSEATFTRPLGTDVLGRDLFSRLGVATVMAVFPIWISVLIGSVLGALAFVGMGQGGGISWVFECLAVVFISIPIGILSFAFAAYFETGLMAVAWVIGMFAMFKTHCQLRDAYHRDRNLSYWHAHIIVGGSVRQRLLKYGILGHWKEELQGTICYYLQAAVIIEASLSYLGFGVQEPVPSFGNILSQHLDLAMKGQWGVSLAVVVAIWLVAAAPRSLLRLIGDR